MKKLLIFLFILLLGVCNKPTEKNNSLVINQKEDISTFSPEKQLDILRKTQDAYYKVVTKEEKIIRWIKLFSNGRFQTPPQDTLGWHDCLSSIVIYLRSWGANMVMEDIPSLLKRIEALRYLGEIRIRNFTDIQSGDLIIFKPNRRGYYHCAIVYEAKEGIITIMDMNPTSRGMGFPVVDAKPDKIQVICEISNPLWFGNYWKENK